MPFDFCDVTWQGCSLCCSPHAGCAGLWHASTFQETTQSQSGKGFFSWSILQPCHILPCFLAFSPGDPVEVADAPALSPKSARVFGEAVWKTLVEKHSSCIRFHNCIVFQQFWALAFWKHCCISVLHLWTNMFWKNTSEKEFEEHIKYCLQAQCFSVCVFIFHFSAFSFGHEVI